MHIFNIYLNDFQDICCHRITDLAKYDIEEDYFEDSCKLQHSPDIIVEQDLHVDKYQFVLSNSELSNYILHRNIWTYFLNKNIPWCMIMESNVDIDTSFENILNTIKAVPEGWDIFFPYDASEFYESNVLNKGMSLLNPNIRENVYNEPYLLGFKWSNSCYFISRNGAKKLLQINDINDRLDDTILALSFDQKLNTYIETVDWFRFSNIKQWEYPERNKIIWDTILKNSPWTKLRKRRVRALLRVISKISLDLNINILLQGGTHLGYVRHGGIMPWDDDVDLGIEEKSLSLFLSALKEHSNRFFYKELIEPGTGCPYFKIWHKNGECISGYDYTFPFIDLWIYNIDNDDLVFKNGIICKDSAIENLLSISFEGSEFKVPYNSIDVLDSRYTDWKTKIRVYPYCHRLEKPCFNRLVLPIVVNENGKLVI